MLDCTRQQCQTMLNRMNQQQLNIAALKKENLRLQKKVARLEAVKISLENTLAIARNPTIAGLPQDVLERAQKLAREEARKSAILR